MTVSPPEVSRQYTGGMWTFGHHPHTRAHTPGHQSVLTGTAEGVLCIAGDAAWLMENLSLPAPAAVTVCAEQSLASLARIRASADRIVMNHDPAVSPSQTSGFPGSARPTRNPRLNTTEEDAHAR